MKSFFFSHILLILLKYHISLDLGTSTEFYFYFALEQYLSVLSLIIETESPDYNIVYARGPTTVINSFGLHCSYR